MDISSKTILPPAIPSAYSLSLSDKPVPAPKALIISATARPRNLKKASVLPINSSCSSVARPKELKTLRAPRLNSPNLPVTKPCSSIP